MIIPGRNAFMKFINAGKTRVGVARDTGYSKWSRENMAIVIVTRI